MYWKGRRHTAPAGLRVALLGILDNRIERKEGEVEELREMREELERVERVEDSRVWKLLDRLWK